MHDPAYVAALKRERDMYRAAGLPERAAEVETELARVTGDAPETAVLEPAENAARPRPARKKVKP